MEDKREVYHVELEGCVNALSLELFYALTISKLVSRNKSKSNCCS
jgi:hypothetical protein